HTRASPLEPKQPASQPAPHVLHGPPSRARCRLPHAAVPCGCCRQRQPRQRCKHSVCSRFCFAVGSSLHALWAQRLLPSAHPVSDTPNAPPLARLARLARRLALPAGRWSAPSAGPAATPTATPAAPAPPAPPAPPQPPQPPQPQPPAQPPPQPPAPAQHQSAASHPQAHGPVAACLCRRSPAWPWHRLVCRFNCLARPPHPCPRSRLGTGPVQHIHIHIH
ncbi:hypothetical protein BC831DRAFT_549785, partial [Entophlyctis helioformis]